MAILIEVVHGTGLGYLKAGSYLKSFDIEEPRGLVFDVTDDPAKAIRYVDLEAALTAWKQQSKNYPLRSDGQPNRPLTALTVTFKTVD